MSSPETTRGQEWAAIIRRGARDSEIKAVIAALNDLTADRRANQGAVIVACSMVLGQAVVNGGPEIAAEMRAGIASLIEGFAMQVALEG